MLGANEMRTNMVIPLPILELIKFRVAQSHKYRAEHWVVVHGTAKVEIDKKISILKVNQSIYVAKGSKHRLSNTKDIPLTIIEVQSGVYLGEDDILRYEDNYGRE